MTKVKTQFNKIVAAIKIESTTFFGYRILLLVIGGIVQFVIAIQFVLEHRTSESNWLFGFSLLFVIAGYYDIHKLQLSKDGLTLTTVQDQARAVSNESKIQILKEITTQDGGVQAIDRDLDEEEKKSYLQGVLETPIPGLILEIPFELTSLNFDELDREREKLVERRAAVVSALNQLPPESANAHISNPIHREWLKRFNEMGRLDQEILTIRKLQYQNLIKSWSEASREYSARFGNADPLSVDSVKLQNLTSVKRGHDAVTQAHNRVLKFRAENPDIT